MEVAAAAAAAAVSAASTDQACCPRCCGLLSCLHLLGKKKAVHASSFPAGVRPVPRNLASASRRPVARGSLQTADGADACSFIACRL